MENEDSYFLESATAYTATSGTAVPLVSKSDHLGYRQWWRGVVVKHADSQYRGCQSSLVRKATGKHLMNSTSLGKTQSPVSGFCYAQNRVCNAGHRQP